MTPNLSRPTCKRKKGASLLRGRHCTLGVMLLFFLLLFLRNAEIAVAYVTQGLRLCTESVIPSLFPFMVLSELLVGGGLAEALASRLPARLMGLFGFSKGGFGAFLLGLFCGFPVGARCAAIALDAGRIDREEAERILRYATVPSSAFMINAVGLSLWGSPRLGSTLYLTLLGITLTNALLDALWERKRKRKRPPSTVSFAPRAASPTPVAILLTRSVRNAARNMMLVCAYVLFFSSLGGVLEHSIDRLSPPPFFGEVLFSVLELSGGVSHAAGLTSRTMALALTAFGAGWCGLSVHFQVFSVCEGRPLSYKGYLWTKLLHGMIAALLFTALIHAWPALAEESRQAFG